MDESTFQQPTPEQIAAFVDGDPSATDEIVRLVLPQLFQWARTTYIQIPQEELQSQIHQVLAEVCVNHARYNPATSKFTSYVIGLLRRRIRTLAANIRERSVEGEELDDQKLDSPPDTMQTIDTKIVRTAFFQFASTLLDQVERDFLSLLLQGEKRQEAFAAVLAQHGSIVETPNEVKNRKARLERKLRSIADEYGYTAIDLF